MTGLPTLQPWWLLRLVCNLKCQTYSHSCFYIRELMLSLNRNWVYTREQYTCETVHWEKNVEINLHTADMLSSSLRKNAEIHLHTAGALQKYNQALELCTRAAVEEVMPRRQKNTWAFQDPDSSPCSLYCVPQTLQTHCQSFQGLYSFKIVFPHFNILFE